MFTRVHTRTWQNKYALWITHKLTLLHLTCTSIDRFIVNSFANWGQRQIPPQICLAQHLKYKDTKCQLPVNISASDKSLTNTHIHIHNRTNTTPEEKLIKNWYLSPAGCDVPVCILQNDTWLSEATLRSMWNVWEHFWEAVSELKVCFRMQRLPCGF